MKKLLPLLIVGTVFTVFTLAFRNTSPAPASLGIFDTPVEAAETDLEQIEIDVPTIGAGGIPAPLTKNGSGNIIRPMAAENAYHEAYNDLYYAMSDVRATCSLSRYQLTREVVTDLFADVINHSPELFYVNGRLGISYNKTTGIVSSVSFTYTMTNEEIGQASAFYQSEIDRILSELPDPAMMSSLDKALWLHDYLCVRYAYDSTLTNYDAYTFFRDRKGVCQGYTLAYMALLNACGIRTDFASSADMNHIWNLIELDGRWYHVDVTWDDPVHSSGSDIPGRAGHDNFLCSDQAIAATGHYNWTSYTCNSTRYDGGYLDTIQTAMAWLNGSWYCVDKQDGSVRVLTFPGMESRRIFKVEGTWYRWGDSLYYVYSYVNICSVNGKIYYSMPSAIGCYDPTAGTLQTVTNYTAGEGYIYALYADSGTLHYKVSTAPGGAAVREYTYELEAQDPGTDPIPPATEPPETADPPDSYVEYLNLTCGDDPAAALVSNAGGAEGQTVRILMIASAARLAACADPVFTVSFEQNGAEALRYQIRGRALLYYQSVTDGSDRFTAAEGYLLFGVTVNEIPPEAWSGVRIALTDGAGGQVLCSSTVENGWEH